MFNFLAFAQQLYSVLLMYSQDSVLKDAVEGLSLVCRGHVRNGRNEEGLLLMTLLLPCNIPAGVHYNAQLAIAKY